MDSTFDIKNNAKHRDLPIIREESRGVLISEIKRCNPRHVLEIGTAVGYSGINILNNCSGDLITIENNLKLVEEAKINFQNAGLASRVTIIPEDCVSTIGFMVGDGKYDNHFDFIFLDGPKAQYGNMIDGLVMMLKSGGTILVDDVLFRGYISGEKTAPSRRFRTIIARMKNFINEFLKRDDLVNAKLLEIEDGLLVAQKK